MCGFVGLHSLLFKVHSIVSSLLIKKKKKEAISTDVLLLHLFIITFCWCESTTFLCFAVSESLERSRLLLCPFTRGSFFFFLLWRHRGVTSKKRVFELWSDVFFFLSGKRKSCWSEGIEAQLFSSFFFSLLIKCCLGIRRKKNENDSCFSRAPFFFLNYYFFYSSVVCWIAARFYP